MRKNFHFYLVIKEKLLYNFTENDYTRKSINFVLKEKKNEVANFCLSKNVKWKKKAELQFLITLWKHN